MESTIVQIVQIVQIRLHKNMFFKHCENKNYIKIIVIIKRIKYVKYVIDHHPPLRLRKKDLNYLSYNFPIRSNPVNYCHLRGKI